VDGGNTISHVLSSTYKCSYQCKAVDDTTGGWFVILTKRV